jgi:hypothetical protein
MMVASIAEYGRRAIALRHRRLGVEIKLANEPGYSQPGITFDRYARMGPTSTLAAGHGQTIPIELVAGRLDPIPSLAGDCRSRR